jgi:hypothetical protein
MIRIIIDCPRCKKDEFFAIETIEQYEDFGIKNKIEGHLSIVNPMGHCSKCEEEFRVFRDKTKAEYKAKLDNWK